MSHLERFGKSRKTARTEVGEAAMSVETVVIVMLNLLVELMDAMVHVTFVDSIFCLKIISQISECICTFRLFYLTISVLI